MTISLDPSVLLSYYQAKTGQLNTSSGSSTTGSGSTAASKIPTAPWTATPTAAQTSALVTSVMNGGKFVDPTAAKLDVPGASDDYKKLFALYQGLSALNDIATQASTAGSYQLAQLSKTFASGMSQVNSFMSTLTLSQLRLTQGVSLTTDPTNVGTPNNITPVYTTAPLYTGGINDAVPQFQGDVNFSISVTRGKSSFQVPIDLSQMGDTTRSMSNVVSYINSQLSAAGVDSRFAVDRIPAQPRTVTVGSTTVTLPAVQDSFALQIKSDSTETVSLSAPSTSGAVYLTQASGTTADADTSNQLIKIQTDQSTTSTPAADATTPSGTPFAVSGEVVAKTLGAQVANIAQTVTGADGSIYVLANITGTTADGQTIKGSQDVALVKYDSAGNVVYTRTLGAENTATGTSMAVSADGKVAIAGSVTGVLDSGDSGTDPTKSDSFVTVFDSQGQEQWTQRRGARDNDTATAVAFGDDGTVYVAGQTSSNMPGAAQVGGQDGYLVGYSWNGQSGDSSKVTTDFTQEFGTTGTDTVSGLAVQNGQIVTAGVENGHAVVRSFTLGAGDVATAGTVRDLGDLQGGSLAGVSLQNGKVIVAGTTENGSLDAGQTTTAYGGGKDAFVASLDASLTPSADDRVSYLGGAGNSSATAMTVSNGEVWLAGTVTGDMPGTTAMGAQDGFVSRIDPETGAVEWSRRFTGASGTVAPTSIAVDPGGASVLDRLGLPSGVVDPAPSQLLTANSSVRAGDSFSIRTTEGGPLTKVTISADDTLQTLATKIQRATGFNITVKVITDTTDNEQKLQITPLNNRSTVELVDGPANQDALGALGLSAGVVRNMLTGSAATSAEKIYGMNLNPDLDLSSAADIKAAQTSLQAAMKAIQSAYNGLVAAATPTPTNTTTGTVPAYLTAQIANYQAGLERLLGASSSSTSA